MTPSPLAHHSPNAVLVGTLNALAAAAPFDTSLTIATDDGDVVYGCNAWAPPASTCSTS